MMGFGCYGNGGSSSSASNLSPLAPPFTVDRSVQKPNTHPLVDLGEPHYAVPLNSSLHNWLGLDSLPSSTAYRYSPAAHLPPTDVYPYAQTSDALNTNLAEAKPYYPAYVSPTIHDDAPLPLPHQAAYDLLCDSHVSTFNGSSHDDYTQSLTGSGHTARWGGLWEGLPSCEQGKPMDDGGFCSKDVNIAGSSIYTDYMNQGVHSSKGFSTFEEASPSNNRLHREKQVGSAGTDQLDYKSFVGQIPKFMPSDYSRTSVLGSTSLLPETYPQEPSQPVVNSRNCQMPYSSSYEKCLREHDNSLNDSTLVMKPSPTLVMRPPATGTSSSAPSTGSFKDVNIGSDAADKDVTGISSSTVKEPRLFPNPEGKNRFDASQLSFHLENEHIFAEVSSTKNEELSSNKGVSKDALGHLFNTKSRLQVPHVNPDGFNFSLDSNEANNPVQNFSESLDYYNPAVDSPCWKGAPVSCFSPFEASDVISPQLSKKLEAYNGSNFQGPQIFPLNNTDDAVKVSSQKPSENLLYHESGRLENGLAPSPKRPAVANMVFRVSDYAMKAGLYHKKPSSGHGVQSSDDNDESKKEYALSNRLIDQSDFKPSHTMQQSLEVGVLTSEKKCTSGTGVADVADVEMNIDDASEGGSSHVPFHAAEHVLSSPSSVDDTPTKLIKSHGGESTPKMYAQTLVNTMLNLSELLLFHCSNEACELKEKDCEALKIVINNLDRCVTKNAGPLISTRETFFPQQATSQLSTELSELHEGVSVGGPQVTKVAAVNVLDHPSYQHVQEEKKHHIVSGKEEEKSSDFVSVWGDAGIVKNDNMTQAIKEILNVNFHDEEEMQPQNLLYRNLWLEAEAELCSINYMTRFNRMKIEMEKCKSHKTEENATDVEKVSRSKFCPDLNTVDKLASEVKGGSPPDTHVPGSPVTSTSGHADDVMARLNILTHRVDNSNGMDTADVEKLSRPTFSSDLNTVNKLASEVKGGSTVDRYVPDSPFISRSSHADDVMARLNILKCRVDNSNSMDTIDVEKLPSSKVYFTLNKVDKLAPEGKNSPAPDISIEDSFVSSTAGHVDDVEASVMARFQILKCRAENSSSVDMEGQQLLEVDLGFASERNHWPVIKDMAEDRILDINVEPVLQHHAANRAVENLTMKEFYLHVKDDPVIQSNKTNRLGDQLAAGWYDSSSSDWEHVLKEELAGQNC